MSVRKEFVVGLVKSMKGHATNESIMAKKLLETRGEVEPRLIPKSRRSFEGKKPTIKVMEGVSYLAFEGSDAAFLCPEKEVDSVIKEIEESPDKVDDILSNNAVQVVEEGADDYITGQEYETILGNFTVVSVEDDMINLVDANGEEVSMDVSSWEDLDPVLVGEATVSETTQTDGVATPVGEVGPYKAYFSYRDGDEVKEGCVTAGTEDEFNAKCREVEDGDSFVEFTDFITPEDDEGSEEDGLLEEDFDMEEPAVTEPPVIESFSAGEVYDTDMGKVKVLSIKDGTLVIQDVESGDKYPVELAEFELIHPKK